MGLIGLWFRLRGIMWPVCLGCRGIESQQSRSRRSGWPCVDDSRDSERRTGASVQTNLLSSPAQAQTCLVVRVGDRRYREALGEL